MLTPIVEPLHAVTRFQPIFEQTLRAPFWRKPGIGINCMNGQPGSGTNF